MGDYNADPNPDKEKARILALQYNFYPLQKTNLDVWTISGSQAVYKFVQKARRSRLSILVNPVNVPSY